MWPPPGTPPAVTLDMMNQNKNTNTLPTILLAVAATLVIGVSLVGCATDAPPPAATRVTMTYACHTRAICAGVEEDALHSLCAEAGASDVLEVGDAAALDYERLMTAVCAAQQGDVEADAPHACEGTYSCDVRCMPTFEACD